MIVDTSAVIAILFVEAERDVLIDALLRATARDMSAGSSIELTAVLTRSARGGLQEANDILAKLAIDIAPVTIAQARIGQAAYAQYGRGTGHSAGLNFGDCFAYALAKESGRPLLYKGHDFAATDVVAAIRPVP